MPASHPTGGGDPVVLRVDGLDLRFGGMMALSGVSLEVKDGEILAIIGPNGAGKTCTLNCINGFYRPQRGEIFFQGKRITPLPPHRIAELGISRTFQNIELFTGLNTLDNLMAARHIHMRRGALAGFLYFGPMRREEIAHRKIVEDIIDFLELEPARKRTVGLLPYGLRKRVELGRALALEPKMLLLDEPMAGMNVEEKEDMARFIIDISELKRIPIVLVEHDMGVVMDIAQRVVVLDFGQKIAEGTPEEIKKDARVIKAYLGEGEIG
jgi:branched-chain amino acid transport system ATP-binding protein